MIGTALARQVGQRSGWRSILLLAIGLAPLACDVGVPEPPAPSKPEASQSPRWVSRYRGGERTWIPETTRYPRVQERPIMVINEVTEYPADARPTSEQSRAAQALVAECFEAAKRHRWLQFKNGIEDGFELLPGDRRHFYKREHIFDGITLDCDRPEFLMYYDTGEGLVLAGFTFYVETPAGRGPQIGGPLTIWHYHVWAPVQCLVENLLLVGQADEQGACPEGEPGHVSPEMLHVWLMDRPKGPFTTSMYLPKEEIATLPERRYAPSVSDGHFSAPDPESAPAAPPKSYQAAEDPPAFFRNLLDRTGPSLHMV